MVWPGLLASALIDSPTESVAAGDTHDTMLMWLCNWTMTNIYYVHNWFYSPDRGHKSYSNVWKISKIKNDRKRTLSSIAVFVKYWNISALFLSSASFHSLCLFLAWLPNSLKTSVFRPVRLTAALCLSLFKGQGNLLYIKALQGLRVIVAPGHKELFKRREGRRSSSVIPHR